MTKAEITIIHCWSAPRSRSTALLYSFEARGSNCVAIDEPLYRNWLNEKTKESSAAATAGGGGGCNNDTDSSKNIVTRPYAQELIQGVPHERSKPQDHYKWKRETLGLDQRIQDAIENWIGGDNSEKEASEDIDKDPQKYVIFCKHMAKHCTLFDFDSNCEVNSSISSNKISSTSTDDIVINHKHLLLIRDPVQMLSSWKLASHVHGNTVSPDEVGIIPLLSIYSNIQSSRTMNGDNIVIVQSDSLATDPVQTLQLLCADLDIDYSESMLQWHDGPHDCDGPWADWWYDNVHKSNGWFESSITNNKYRVLDPSLLPALRSSLPAYNYLESLSHEYETRRSSRTSHKKLYEDPRNEHVLVWIGSPGNGNGRLVPRDMARISPFDSSVQGGDATWEGIRIYRGKILSLDKHLKRLFKSAKALGFTNVHTKEEIIEAIFKTLAVNGMRDGAHMRLTLTRGEKCTSSMNPKFNVYGTTLIILPEWKPTEGATTYDNTRGISLITASTRRNSPSTCDSKIHHNNMINNILPKIQANLAGAEDAIMLDLDGFVSETNATNIFMVDDGVLMTPHADHCLPGITRSTVLALAKELDIPSEVRNISLSEFHAADEVFTTGTMGELTPVTMIDGRVIGSGTRGVITSRLQNEYKKLPERGLDWATEIPPFVS